MEVARNRYTAIEERMQDERDRQLLSLSSMLAQERQREEKQRQSERKWLDESWNAAREAVLLQLNMSELGAGQDTDAGRGSGAETTDNTSSANMSVQSDARGGEAFAPIARGGDASKHSDARTRRSLQVSFIRSTRQNLNPSQPETRNP
jgi:hypothetical protein